MTDPRPRGTTRLRATIALAAGGLLLTAGLGAVLATTTASAVQDYDDRFAAARAADPPVVEDDVASSPLPSVTPAAHEPGTPFEETTPTAAPDGHRYDQWGVRLYDVSDAPDDITYPASLVGDELGNAVSWVDMQLRIAGCMREEGFDYTFKLWWDRSPEDRGSEPLAEDSEAMAALYGTNLTSTGPYDWTQAGCHGRIVHEMGNDDAH
ncbi:hypothetical protein EDF35_2257 [Rathayibacter sp. PhB151]|uniref:hypothetical protein n=1 Tax=Rathayibacter sp. PhB151 TaxID=2485189 RepID=UPI001062FCFC|nr:hypothetical protein [Rathayibacter sp. PhB151]TDX79032.1 hypothetical protein EDF35_2257 [Rathayibacter sp. PhB151]